MVYLHSVGHFHPPNVIDNRFLESLDIGIDDNWIMNRVGIRRRRTVLPLDYVRTERNQCPAAADEAALYTNAQIGVEAARIALQRIGLQPDEIGLVIAGSSAPQFGSPAEACSIAADLGIEAPTYDVNSACATFIAQIWTLSMMNPELLPDWILLVQPESLTRTVDYRDRTNAVLMGDCATAVVVSLKIASRFQIGFTSLHSDPRGWQHAVIPTAGHFQMNGPAVQKFAIRKTMEALETLAPFASSESYFIGHQSNLRMLQSVCEHLGIQSTRHLYNVDEFGNCGSAGAVSVLSQRWSRFASGDHIRMAVVSAGLTWGAAELSVGVPAEYPTAREADTYSLAEQ